MGTILEGFMSMAVLALIGTAVALGISYADLLVIRALFVYIGTHLFFIIVFLFPITIVSATKTESGQNKSSLPYTFILSVLILPAVGAGFAIWKVFPPELNSPPANLAMWAGAIAAPFLALAIIGTLTEAILTQKSSTNDKSGKNAGN
jgi:hypothetical protein